MLQRVCEQLQMYEGCRFVWMALFDEGGSISAVEYAAGSTDMEEAFASLSDKSNAVLPRCVHRAMRAEAALLVTDPGQDCSGCPLERWLAERRAFVVPMEQDGQCFGVLCMVLEPPALYGPALQRLLDETAGFSAFALSRFELMKRDRESDERFWKLYNHMAVGVARVSLDYHILQANAAYCHMLGMTEQELIGKHLSDITMPEVLEENLQKQEQLGRGEMSTYRLQKVFRHRDGHAVYGILDANLIHDAEGNPAYFIGAVVDITERVLAEQALVRERERLKLAADAAHFGVWDLDLVHDELVWDEWMYRLYGVEAKDFRGVYECWLAGVHPDDLERASRDVDLAIAGKKPLDTEFRVRRPDGSVRYIKAFGRVSRNAQGTPVRLTGINYDITEQVLAKEELRQFEWLLEKEGGVSFDEQVDYESPYSDVTELNTNRTLMDAVGKDLLSTMARDLMDLLNSSVAVYEANGDYAFGLFASSWCRVFDSAAFRLCGTDDAKTALESGKWLCHECCWNESAKVAMESGQPVDIECVGGVRLYAVPIRVGDEVIGCINIGYGTPPREGARLLELAEQFDVDVEEVRKAALAYKPRPQYIIDVAKRRCRSVALHIGEVVQRRRIQDAAKAAGERLEVAIEGGGLGTWEWVVPTDELILNERWASMLGYELQELDLYVRQAHALTDPEALPQLHQQMKAHLRGETPYYEAVYRMKHKSGGWVWIHDRGQLIERSDDGSPLRVCGTHTDITRVMRAEEALRESEARFRSYIEKAPYGVFIADETGCYVDVNPAACDITGYTRGELLKLRVGDLYSAEVHEQAEAHFSTLLRDGFSEGVLPFRRKNGDLGFWIITAVRLNDNRFLGFVRDITRRQQLEEQLRQAQKLDAVGQLAGGVAHDFNNLLMGIMGYVELCQDEIGEQQPVREWLDQIMREARRSANIVGQLLAFSRKQTISPKRIDLNDVVENILKMLRHLIGEDITLQWKPGTNLDMLKMDPGQIDQILANLCINARDAIGGTGIIAIETHAVSLGEEYTVAHPEVMPGDYVMLAVSDDGCGMDAQTRANVFEPFFTTKPTGAGTGLGLATVYGIVKQNNGSINVYSEPGEGTTFRIYFPRCAEPETDVAAPGLPKPVELAGTETILVVEDEESIREMLKMMLQKSGYTMLIAASPQEAMCLVAEQGGRIDLLITDVVMPEMNGRDLAAKLLAAHPHIKVLYMSGYTADVIAHRGVLEEHVAFLSKPFSRDDLLQKLRDLL